jgi:hypothetical protein
VLLLAVIDATVWHGYGVHLEDGGGQETEASDAPGVDFTPTDAVS